MVPVPAAVMRQRAEDFDKRIAQAKDNKRAWGDKRTPAREKWAAKVQTLEAKRPEIERAKQGSIERARAQLSLLDDQGRKALMSHRARLEALDRKLEARVEELRAAEERRKQDLAAELKALRAAHEKAADEHARKLRELVEKIGRLRSELIILAGAIRNAHLNGYHLGVRIDAEFEK